MRNLSSLRPFNLKAVLPLLVMLLSFSLATAQQPGDLDPTFNPIDQGFGFGDGASEYTTSVNLQPDGKIIIGGLFLTFHGADLKRIVRLNPDGSIDASFNIGSGFNFYVYSTVLQPDGKILVGGNFTSFNGRNYTYAFGKVKCQWNPGYRI